MILYMFPCHSPKSSHPLPLPQSPKDFYASVSLLLSPIQGYCYHLSKFHIYPLVYCIGDFPDGSDGKVSVYIVRDLGWEDSLEKEMAIHSSVLAWRIPGMGEPGGLPSMGSHRVGHD